MFSGREQGPDLMNRTPSFSSILLFSFDTRAVQESFCAALVFFGTICRFLVQRLQFDRIYIIIETLPIVAKNRIIT